MNLRDILNKIEEKLSERIRILLSNKPRKIPKELFNSFTFNGKILVKYSFRDDSYPDKKPLVLSKQKIEKMIKEITLGKTWYYGETDNYLRKAMEKYSSYIKNKEGLDIGSRTGWYSAFALSYGAKRSFILEYNSIISKDERVIPLQVKYLSSYDKKFDFATSISSFEHDGLGRYGDPINPNGDLEAMKKLKEMIKKGGLLFLSVPIGNDTIVWNMHRIYGRIRFPMLIKDWKLIDSLGFSEQDFNRSSDYPIQPIFVLKNE